ncbi:cytochrome P450 [Apiospora rasikravindrae]|uniref:Cytochrome P450 n=1 Tax=Apiospora rasikravindrae TaxID=990691 RepID=A0ABR1S070_9PEZI
MTSPVENVSWKHGVVLAALYFLTLAFHRLFLHPLAGFPGPRLAAVTRDFEAYYDVVCNGQYTFKIAEMHKRYGPIIRISPHELYVSDPSFYEKLYNQDGKWDKYDWAWDAFGAPLSTICTAKHHVHKRRRAVLNHFFSKASVASRIDIVQRSVSELCRKVDEFADSRSIQISLGAAISAFTRDVSIEFAIGKRYHILDALDLDADEATLPQTSGSLWQRSKHFRWYVSLMKRMPSSMVQKTGGDGVNAFVFFLQYYSTLAAAPPGDDGSGDTTTRTIVHEILNAQIPPAEKSPGRVFEEVGTITRGGFETVANSLRMILYHIYADPEVLRRLRAELAEPRRDRSQNDQGSSDISLRTLKKLLYLTAVLMEGLRLSPGLSTRSQRIAPDRDLVYNGRVIPAGTPVGMTTLLMHHDPALYPDPKRFDPERWMDMDVRRKAEKTYAPFGRGTRICLGMHLAWAELYLVVAALVQRFDFQFDPAALADLECSSDQFIIGTSGRDGLKTFVSRVPV